MAVFDQFQKLFPKKNTIGTIRAEKNITPETTCKDDAPSAAPNPTPSTTYRGSGVGSCGRRSSSIGRERKEGVARIVLTDRDKDILTLCYEQQFLLKEHIEAFFDGCSARRVNFRLQKLIAGGYLRRESIAAFSSDFIFRLTNTGRQVVRQINGHSANVLGKYITKVNPATLYHDALVTSCRIRIAKFWNTEFLPERALKGLQVPEVPDGIWTFASGKMIALEVECSDKGRSRFLRRLDSFGAIDALAFVIYVTPNKKMLAIVRNYLNQSTPQQPVGVILWDDLRNGTPSVLTPRGSVDIFEKREW